MLVYEFDRYWKFLRERVEELRGKGRIRNFSALAEKISVQRSYLSRVLSGFAHLNADQLFLAGQALEISEPENEFLILLLEAERTQIRTRKLLLQAEIQKRRDEHLQSQEFFDDPLHAKTSGHALQDYYLNPLAPLIHMFLMVPAFKKDLRKIANRLNVPLNACHEALRILEASGLVRGRGPAMEVTVPLLHLDPHSPLQRVHNTWSKLMAMQKLRDLPSSEDYYLSVSFCATEATRLQTKIEFLKFLKRVSANIKKSPSEDVFHMNFDLFRV